MSAFGSLHGLSKSLRGISNRRHCRPSWGVIVTNAVKRLPTCDARENLYLKVQARTRLVITLLKKRVHGRAPCRCAHSDPPLHLRPGCCAELSHFISFHEGSSKHMHHTCKYIGSGCFISAPLATIGTRHLWVKLVRHGFATNKIGAVLLLSA